LALIPPRVSGFKTQRLDDYWSLRTQLPGASVLDIGCNRGLWSIQAALAGARAVHGCDNYRPGIEAVRQVLADFPGLDVRFEVVDLSRGPDALAYFDWNYDIVLVLSVIHKLRRQMSEALLADLLRNAASRTERAFVCRGNLEDLVLLAGVLRPLGFERDGGAISDDLQPAVIWRRSIQP